MTCTISDTCGISDVTKNWSMMYVYVLHWMGFKSYLYDMMLHGNLSNHVTNCVYILETMILFLPWIKNLFPALSLEYLNSQNINKPIQILEHNTCKESKVYHDEVGTNFLLF